MANPAKRAAAAPEAASAPPPSPSISMEQIVRTQLAALSQRINLPDSSGAMPLAEQHLKRCVLQNYSEQLAELEEGGAMQWLLGRLVELEARVLLLQGAVAATPRPTPSICPLSRTIWRCLSLTR